MVKTGCSRYGVIVDSGSGMGCTSTFAPGERRSDELKESPPTYFTLLNSPPS